MQRHSPLWRGSLLPLGREAALKPESRLCQIQWCYLPWACCAVQREQAPSPQKRPGHPIYLNESALIQTKALNLYENYYKLRD
ncbi:hypothetical protein B1219_27315 [Pseudomonas ogarae]|nr:hypothetical protein B1219_27315 [Pseudomonas ogarae]OPG79353.1 hypothetical protein B1218_10820 [Pseudomonas ogarae]